MRALVSRPDAPFAELGEAPEPEPRSDQALVAVRAISLNRGEVRRLEALAPGTPAGWDLAGEVIAPAADGSGPAAGARVVGLVNPYAVGEGSAAWAQRAAVPSENLAELPDGVGFAAAAALPVAGLTALGALDVGGFLLGRRVLVTGASGGVGRFGIQLARLGGAHVTALARRTEGLAELGADEVITALGDEVVPGEEFACVLDGVGGPVLGTAIRHVAAGGVVVSYASTVPEPVAYPARDFFARAPRARLRGFYLFDEVAHTRAGGAGLRRLAGLVAAGALDPQVDREWPWTRAGEAIGALLDRQVAGKAVLLLD